MGTILGRLDSFAGLTAAAEFLRYMKIGKLGCRLISRETNKLVLNNFVIILGHDET